MTITWLLLFIICILLYVKAKFQINEMKKNLNNQDSQQDSQISVQKNRKKVVKRYRIPSQCRLCFKNVRRNFSDNI